jgi:hypothetical protein
VTLARRGELVVARAHVRAAVDVGGRADRGGDRRQRDVLDVEDPVLEADPVAFGRGEHRDVIRPGGP